MLDWWLDFLEGSVRHGNDFISFLSYDDEHHRIAIVNMPDLEPRSPKSEGLEHFAFTYASIDDLFGQYERMKAKGISPYWTINHGMTLSAYYRDPDGNQVETQVDSFVTDVAKVAPDTATNLRNDLKKVKKVKADTIAQVEKVEAKVKEVEAKVKKATAKAPTTNAKKKTTK